MKVNFVYKPLTAPIPVPTITAVGVANPRAQGQAMMITEIANLSANLIWLVSVRREYVSQSKDIQIVANPYRDPWP